MDIIIMTPHLSINDAVGHDVVMQYHTVIDAGFTCHIFAQTVAADFSETEIISEEYCLYKGANEDILVIYHHAVFWEKGEEILTKMCCPTILKYHNITPAHFFKDYDSASYFSTKEGAKQTHRLIQLGFICEFIGDSKANASELASLGVASEKLDIIYPFTPTTKLSQIKDNPHLKDRLRGPEKEVLFVGRVVPNKGIHHLIHTIATYVQNYDANIHLNIVGSFQMKNPSYYKSLEKLIHSFGLTNTISFTQNINDSDLATYYRNSSAFLICSEHEGFCVPILEAQALKLPIIALSRTAVKETLGEGQLFIDKIDYRILAASLRRVLTDSQLKEHLVNQGLTNILRYKQDLLRSQTRELIQKYV